MLYYFSSQCILSLNNNNNDNNNNHSYEARGVITWRFICNMYQYSPTLSISCPTRVMSQKISFNTMATLSRLGGTYSYTYAQGTDWWLSLYIDEGKVWGQGDRNEEGSGSRCSGSNSEAPSEGVLNSMVYPGGPPSLDTEEMVTGAEHTPGLGVLGGDLCVENGMIRTRVK